MTIKHIALTILLALFIGACAPATTPAPTPDVNAISTAAAQTVIANITNTALAEPPTSLPTATETIVLSPTATLTPTFSLTLGPGTQGLLCDDANYDLATVDVTIPDGTPMTAGQEFLKTWKIKNTGACSWGAGYNVVFGYGEKMGGAPAAITTTVVPGQEVEVSVQFKAPAKAGEYKSWWRMANARGSAFGKFFSVWIIVR
jgi:next-to-BRCA1 protein 1